MLDAKNLQVENLKEYGISVELITAETNQNNDDFQTYARRG